MLAQRNFEQKEYYVSSPYQFITHFYWVLFVGANRRQPAKSL